MSRLEETVVPEKPSTSTSTSTSLSSPSTSSPSSPSFVIPSRDSSLLQSPTNTTATAASIFITNRSSPSSSTVEPEQFNIEFSLEWIEHTVSWEPEWAKSLIFERVHLNNILARYPEKYSNQIKQQAEVLQSILKRKYGGDNNKNKNSNISRSRSEKYGDDILEYKFIWFFKKENNNSNNNKNKKPKNIKRRSYLFLEESETIHYDTAEAQLCDNELKSIEKEEKGENVEKEKEKEEKEKEEKAKAKAKEEEEMLNSVWNPILAPDIIDDWQSDDDDDNNSHDNKSRSPTLKEGSPESKENREETTELITLEDFLSQYNHGIIIEYNNKKAYRYDNSSYVVKELCSKNITGKPVKIGILRGYCDNPHEWCLDWKGITTNPNDKRKCMHCGKTFDKVDELLPWLTGIAKEHNNQLNYFCGLCMVGAHLEALDPTLVGINDYFGLTYRNARNGKALCLVHRLFTSTLRLLLTVSERINKIQSDPNSTESIPQIINFLKMWIQMLWKEDFPPGSISRKLLNHIISHLLELSVSKSSNAPSIHAATQMLLAVYRKEYLAEKNTRHQTINEITLRVLDPPRQSESTLKPRVSTQKKSKKQNWSNALLDVLIQYHNEAKQDTWKNLFTVRATKGKEKETKGIKDTKETKRQRSFTDYVSVRPTQESFGDRMIQESYCIAEQLTLIMSEKLKSIRAPEFLRKGWTGENGQQNSPNIVALREFGECISLWVKIMVISPEIPRRKEMIERMIHIGIRLKQLQNQYGLMQVFAGIYSPAMATFKHAWTQIEGRTPEFVEFKKETAELLKQSGGFRNLINALEGMDPPAIPCLWITLKHAFMLDEVLRQSKISRADPNQTGRLWDIYEKFDGFRKASYQIEPIYEIQKYLHSQLDRARILLNNDLSDELESFVKSVAVKDVEWLKPTSDSLRS